MHKKLNQGVVAHYLGVVTIQTRAPTVI